VNATILTNLEGQQLPTLKQAHKWWQYEPAGKKIIDFLSKTSSTNVTWSKDFDQKLSDDSKPSEVERFVDSSHKLVCDLASYGDATNLHSRIKGFPVHFVRHVCEKVFSKEYSDVDFSQALTCIDYLRDLECTRRTALRDAALRLGIDKESWRTILADEPEAYQWVSSVQKQELVIESSYAATFLDLRIWVSNLYTC
jgi:hypothetical protein